MVHIEVELWQVRTVRRRRQEYSIYEGEGVTVNPKKGRVRIDSTQHPIDKDSEVVLNGQPLGDPDRVREDALVWEDVSDHETQAILSRHEPAPEATEAPLPLAAGMPSSPSNPLDLAGKTTMRASRWANADQWVGSFTVAVPSNWLLVMEERSDNSNGPSYFNHYGAHGNIEVAYTFGPWEENPHVLVSIITYEGAVVGQGPWHQFEFSRPDMAARPAERDWWAERRVEGLPPIEEGAIEFDEGRLQTYRAPFSLGREAPDFYRGAAITDYTVTPAPGGFNVAWTWQEGHEPVEDPYREDPLRAKYVRVFWRPTALRGSGQPWRASQDPKDMDPSGEERFCYVPYQLCPSGHPVDVMLVPITTRTRRLAPTPRKVTFRGEHPQDAVDATQVNVAYPCSHLRFPAFDPAISDEELMALRQEYEGEA